MLQVDLQITYAEKDHLCTKMEPTLGNLDDVHF